MTLAQAVQDFIEHLAGQSAAPAFYLSALSSLTDRFGGTRPVSAITPNWLHSFLACWYVEQVSATSPSATLLSRLPEPQEMIVALQDFFRWLAQSESGAPAAARLAVIAELAPHLPRALQCFTALTRHLAERGGAVTFTEYLSSFEAGGRSAYDLDTPEEVGSLEGYFRILRIAGTEIEAEEIITETIIWPIRFPESVTEFMTIGFLLNLEVVRLAGEWRIAGCGFVYPPGTDVLGEE